MPGTWEQWHQCSRQTLKASGFASERAVLSAGHLDCANPASLGKNVLDSAGAEPLTTAISQELDQTYCFSMIQGSRDLPRHRNKETEVEITI